VRVIDRIRRQRHACNQREAITRGDTVGNLALM
jgi:hypothetical protein